jgi:hypothetical protein
MIPASGEFTYATEAIRKASGGTTSAENLNALPDEADIVVALDRLQAMAPAVESVSLVVAWFGNDLRAGNCKVKPGVEVPTGHHAQGLVGERRQPGQRASGQP